MLLYFILGIIFIAIGIPFLEAITSILTAWSEYVVYIFAFKVYLLKEKMGIDKEKKQQEEQFQFGFQQSPVIEIERQQEEEEDQ